MRAQAEDKVNIMTLHSAKGLEFGTVFLPGWEEGLFPHQRSLDEKGRAGLEEERRLAYVGITRAKRRATISFAQNRRVHNLWQSALPSRFIDELPEDHVEVAPMSNTYGGYGLGTYGGSRFEERTRPSPTPMPRRAGSAPSRPMRKGEAMRSAPHIIEGQLVARETEGEQLRARATASSTRNSAMAASPMSTATSSPSISTRPARSG